MNTVFFLTPNPFFRCFSQNKVTILNLFFFFFCKKIFLKELCNALNRILALPVRKCRSR